MHRKIMTADKLAARGLQHNSVCPLCHLEPEDARHLLINCSFSREVLRLLWSWFQIQGSPSSCPQEQGPADWLCSNVQKAAPSNRKTATRVLLYHPGGTCGRNGTKEFSRPCNIMSSRWLHPPRKKMIFALQLSVRADLQCQGSILL
jgi:hypothetical protein